MKNLATDAEFVANLKSGKAWEEIVAERFCEVGFDAKAAPLRIRPGVAARRRFADNGDVLVTMPDFTWRFEVKSRKVAFGDEPESYPYDEVFVINVRPWHRKLKKPPAIILISQETGAALVVPSSSEPEWRERKISNRAQGVSQDIYMVSRLHLKRWAGLLDWMRTFQ